jgi:hypothetical protein
MPSFDVVLPLLLLLLLLLLLDSSDDSLQETDALAKARKRCVHE